MGKKGSGHRSWKKQENFGKERKEELKKRSLGLGRDDMFKSH